MSELTKLTKRDLDISKTSDKDRIAAITAMQKRLGINAEKSYQTGELRLVRMMVDATDSMKSVWGETKKNLHKLVSRLTELFPGVEISITAFRDYCDYQGIIEHSSVTADPVQLGKFIDSIYCQGGGDIPEAVEVAIENLLKNPGDIGILVGDAPPHGVDDVTVNGKDFRIIADELGIKKIPVYTVATNQNQSTVSSFAEIAKRTGGESFTLDRIDDLIDLISIAVAKKGGQLKGLAAIMASENPDKELTANQKKLYLKVGD